MLVTDIQGLPGRDGRRAQNNLPGEASILLLRVYPPHLLVKKPGCTLLGRENETNIPVCWFVCLLKRQQRARVVDFTGSISCGPPDSHFPL